VEKGADYVANAKQKGADYAEVAKEKGADYAKSAKEKGSEFVDAAKEKGADMAKAAKEKGAEGVKEKVQEVGQTIKEKGREYTARGKEAVDNLKEKAAEAAGAVDKEKFTKTVEGPSYGSREFGTKEKDDYNEGFEKPGQMIKKEAEKEVPEGIAFYSSTYTVAIGSNDQFEGLRDSDKPVIVDFYSATCGDSKRIFPKLIEKTKRGKGKWVLAGADMDHEMIKPISKAFNVKKSPTVVLFHRGKVIDHVSGKDDKNLDKLFDKANELKGGN